MSLSTAPISVIVPCLNAEKTLGEAIESVLEQTAPPIEVLVIDDNSRDRSVEVARSFGARVRILRNPGRGPGAARRIGVEQARGQFIAFIDADDVVEPTKHEKQLEAMEQHGPNTLVHTGCVAFWADGSRPDRIRVGGEQAVGRCTRVVFERNPVCGASTMLARSLILELGNYQPSLVGTEDYGMSLAASTRCDFVYIPQPLYRMRRHLTNITNRSSHMAYMHWLAQDDFRARFPAAFAELPAESVAEYMIEPVIRAAVSAYWRRDGRDYSRLLRLAVTIAPRHPDVQRLYRRRWLPLSALRWWDRMELLRQGPSRTVSNAGEH